jgi:hypothetical protein
VDAGNFDGVTRAVGAVGARRPVLELLAGGVAGLLGQAAASGKRRDHQGSAEKAEALPEPGRVGWRVPTAMRWLMHRETMRGGRWLRWGVRLSGRSGLRGWGLPSLYGYLRRRRS